MSEIASGQDNDSSGIGGPTPKAAATSNGLRRRLGRLRIGSLLSKLLIIGVVVMLLSVMLDRVALLVYEREARHRDVSYEIGALWGRAQTFEGPVLAIPYGRPLLTAGVESLQRAGTLYFFPERLDVDAQIEPQLRYRGIFQSVVYRIDAALKARFVLPSQADLRTAAGITDSEDTVLLWDSAFIAIGVSDMRSIGDLIELQAGEERLPFVPGTRMPALLPSGMSVDLPVDVNRFNQGNLDVSVALRLNGSESVNVLPLGRETRTRIRSGWPSPKFVGAYLPGSHEIGAQGFDAHWKLSYFGRDYGQVIHDAELGKALRDRLVRSSFGVVLYQPVTPYRKVERAIKYGMLFVIFTFGLYYIIEVVSRRRIHPVQYATVGVPLCLFYLMLVAFAEHIGFIPAYLLGSSAIVALIGLYSISVLASLRRAALVVLALIALYGYLYTMLEKESYSLLWGALGLLLLTAGFMYGTRKFNWYGPESDYYEDDTAPAMETSNNV